MMEWVIEDTDTGAKNDEIDWSFETGDGEGKNNDENGMHPMQYHSTSTDNVLLCWLLTMNYGCSGKIPVDSK